MKRSFLFLALFLLLHFLSFSQVVFQRVINFETNGQYAVIDPGQVNNIWQKGTPHKTIFDSAWSVPYAIVTDTSNLYPANNFSSFRVKMEFIGGCWGTGELTFWHKYQTDSLHAGGFIDVSYDTSAVYNNIIFDTVPMIGIYAMDFYTAADTITGNIPAFSGNSNGWTYSSVFWTWFIGVDNQDPYHDSLTIRFNFKSDAVAVSKEGWMIDNIFLKLDYCSGGIPEKSRQKRVSIYPNPVGREASIALVNFAPGDCELQILDAMGRQVTDPQKIETPVGHFINTGLENGVYFYRIKDRSGTNLTGKFVILK